MKQLTILAAIFLLPLAIFSQTNKYEYLPKVKNRVEVTNLIGKITLKNTTGNAIVIESDFDKEIPERAIGLNLLGVAEDNSGLGVHVKEEDGVVLITGVSKKIKEYEYTISIPTGIAVSIDYYSPFANELLEIDSYQGSVEIKTLSAGVKLTNCNGPFAVNSTSGNIEAVFNELNQEEPTSLASISGLVDVTLPSQSKATVNISNITGNVYNNLDLKSMSEKKKDERAKGLSEMGHKSDNEFTLNGGGQKLLLKSISGNIYLRKK